MTIARTLARMVLPPFALLRTIDTGSLSNHVNFARNRNGTFAYVTVGGLNEVQVFRRTDFVKVATMPSAVCRTASGRPVTARAYMPVSKTTTV